MGTIEKDLPDQVVLGDLLGGLGQEPYFFNTTTPHRDKGLCNALPQPFNWHQVIQLPYWWGSARRKIMSDRTVNLTR